MAATADQALSDSYSSLKSLSDNDVDVPDNALPASDEDISASHKTPAETTTPIDDDLPTLKEDTLAAATTPLSVLGREILMVRKTMLSEKAKEDAPALGKRVADLPLPSKRPPPTVPLTRKIFLATGRKKEETTGHYAIVAFFAIPLPGNIEKLDDKNEAKIYRLVLVSMYIPDGCDKIARVVHSMVSRLKRLGYLMDAYMVFRYPTSTAKSITARLAAMTRFVKKFGNIEMTKRAVLGRQVRIYDCPYSSRETFHTAIMHHLCGLSSRCLLPLDSTSYQKNYLFVVRVDPSAKKTKSFNCVLMADTCAEPSGIHFRYLGDPAFYEEYRSSMFAVEK